MNISCTSDGGVVPSFNVNGIQTTWFESPDGERNYESSNTCEYSNGMIIQDCQGDEWNGFQWLEVVWNNYKITINGRTYSSTSMNSQTFNDTTQKVIVTISTIHK